MSNPRQNTPPSGPLKHSGAAIASFIVSLSSFASGLAALFVFNMGSKSFSAGPFCSCGLPVGLAGIILGIVGLLARDRKKLFAYLGLALGVAIMLINFGLIMAGKIN